VRANEITARLPACGHQSNKVIDCLRGCFCVSFKATFVKMVVVNDAFKKIRGRESLSV
jgi:hypothetical protein